MANIQINQLPESTDISSEDFVHIKKTDLVDYKMKQKNLMVIGVQDTKTNLTTLNPILKRGQFSLETDTRLLKIGDGVTPYNLLSPASNLATNASIVNTSFTAELNTIYFVDTSLGSVNIQMPTPVNKESKVIFIDYKGTWSNTPCVLTYNANKYNGTSEDFFLDLNWVSITVQWSGSNNIGWRTY